MRAVKEGKRSKRSRFLRDAMVNVQIARRGIRNKRVLLAMRQIPREVFLERRFADAAYEDGAVPIPKNPDGVQRLMKVVRAPDGRFVEEEIEEVRFVPLVSG